MGLTIRQNLETNGQNKRALMRFVFKKIYKKALDSINEEDFPRSYLSFWPKWKKKMCIPSKL